jgi:DNA adenine methylase
LGDIAKKVTDTSVDPNAHTEEDQAGPFLKWPGGKTRLLSELHRRLPVDLEENKITKYVEPFVGGGGFFFSIAKRYPVDEYVINDKNKILMATYRVVRDKPRLLIDRLNELQEKYLAMDKSAKKKAYYQSRDEFNSLMKKGTVSEPVEASSLFVFLNKTCYNGIFRMNSDGEFNVPIGDFEKPRICDEAKILGASRILLGTVIRSGDFGGFLERLGPLGQGSFMYVDPPYAIQNGHNGFLGYSDKIFSWKDQEKLARLMKCYSSKGVSIMISNAQHQDISTLYEGFYKQSVERKTVIGAIDSSRRTISEMVITSYPHEKEVGDISHKRGEK